MSLYEMINCHIWSLCALCSQLMLEQVVREGIKPFSDSPEDPIGDFDKGRVRGWLKIAGQSADEFEWQAVHDRIATIERRLQRPMSHRDLATEYRVLRETIEDGLKGQLIYRYPRRKKEVLWNWQADWATVLGSFPSAREDIQTSVDLWSLGHSTACVFHLMRVLEHGLRALAHDVGISFDVQNWQNVIDQIESEVRALGKGLPRGVGKSERLQFLSSAAKEFVYFKDGWRNYVSHNRSNYDEHQARSAIEHVRSFMTVLASKLGEEAA